MSNFLRLLVFVFFIFSSLLQAQPIIYSVEYSDRPENPPDLMPVFTSYYKGFENIYLVLDNWYYASHQRADSVKADAFIIPGGSTSDVPFYDGRLDSYVDLLRNPGRPALGFCAGIQFLHMARGGICARRSGEHGNEDATIYLWDEIFDGCPNPYTDRGAHNYSIVDPADELINMAVTRRCFVTFSKHITMPVYGSQLHIELMNNGNSAGPAILSNFQDVIMQRKFHGIAEALAFPGEPGKVLLKWWRAKTDSEVTYHIFQSNREDNMTYSSPIVETEQLEYELTGLNPDSAYYFAVRAISPAFDDSNTAVYPIKPDGHREIVFQNGKEIGDTPYEDCEATVIYEKYPDANFGKLGSPGTDKLYWWDSGLVQFKNIHQHLAGKKIIGGKLTFIFVGGVESWTNGNYVADISIHRVLKPWNEGRGAIFSDALNGEVTWNAAQHNGVTWEIPGCQGETDRSGTPIFTHTIKGDGTGIEFDGTVELPAELIQTWVDHPDSNCGLLYEKRDNYPSDTYFYFEDNDDDWFMNHPRLTVYYLDEEPTVVQNENNPSVPAAIRLLTSYPNPFNSATTILFENDQLQHVELSVYNVRGQHIRKLFAGDLKTGHQTFMWDGRDASGADVTSGIYLCVLSTASGKKVQRMALIR